MPRDLPLGNGTMQVNFDLKHRLVDLYYPYVGGENHLLGHQCRFGVWVDGGGFAWVGDDGWQDAARYAPGTLVTDVAVEHAGVGVRLALSECVDFHVNAFVRRIAVQNLVPEEREIRLFCHHDLDISGNDHYQQVSRDIGPIPGNPWILCTLWLAEWYISRAACADDLRRPLEGIRWAASKALPSGVLPEQIHPHDGTPLSVSPLTWSHAAFVHTVLRYLDRLHALDLCPTCGQPRYRREESHQGRAAALNVRADPGGR